MKFDPGERKKWSRPPPPCGPCSGVKRATCGEKAKQANEPSGVTSCPRPAVRREDRAGSVRGRVRVHRAAGRTTRCQSERPRLRACVRVGVGPCPRTQQGALRPADALGGGRNSVGCRQRPCLATQQAPRLHQRPCVELRIQVGLRPVLSTRHGQRRSRGHAPSSAAAYWPRPPQRGRHRGGYRSSPGR